LRLEFGYDVDCEVDFVVVVPEVSEVGESGGEEGGFEVLKEVDALEVGGCGVGDLVRWRGG